MTGVADVGPNASDADVEIERLRQEVARLRAQLVAQRAPMDDQLPAGRAGRASRARWRTVTATVLVVLGCLLSPLAVLSVWGSSQLNDTDRYVATVAPLASDPDVQAAVANNVSNRILGAIDINALTTEALQVLSRQNLPPRLAALLPSLSGPISGGVESFVRSQVSNVVASPVFAQAWEQANRVAHQQVVNVLTGAQGGAVSTKNGAVTVDLAPVIEQVKTRLVAQGFTVASKVPSVNATFTLVDSPQITKIQSAYRLLTTLGTWLPVLVVVLIGVGVYVAKNHRRTLVGAALGVAGAMLALGVGIAVARVMYLGAVPTAVLPHDAATVVFDTAVAFLRSAIRVTFVGALLIAAGAFLTGRSVTAVRTRAAFVRWIGALRGSAESAGVTTGRTGEWIYRHRRILRVAAVGVAAAVVTLWPYPTVGVIIGVALCLVVAIGLIELLGRPSAVLEATSPGSAS